MRMAIIEAESPPLNPCRSGDLASKLQASQLACQLHEVQDAFRIAVEKGLLNVFGPQQYLQALNDSLQEGLKQLLSTDQPVPKGEDERPDETGPSCIDRLMCLLESNSILVTSQHRVGVEHELCLHAVCPCQ